MRGVEGTARKIENNNKTKQKGREIKEEENVIVSIEVLLNI